MTLLDTFEYTYIFKSKYSFNDLVLEKPTAV